MSNYKQPTLTAAQMQALAPCERFFTQAVEAAWCSYPGQDNLRLMLDTWKDVVGKEYIGFRFGCPDCMLNLVRDLGVIYLANKKAQDNAAKAPEKPVDEPEPAQASNTPEKKPNAGNGKKKGKK